MPFLTRLIPAMLVASALCAASPAQAVQPAPLGLQLERLAGLLGDSHATAAPERAMLQAVNLPNGRALTLAVLALSSYGGGTNHRQYLAVFEQDRDERGPRGHFTLQDVILIGEKGWRAVRELKAKARADDQTGHVHLLLPALVNVPGDALHTPSKPQQIHLVLGRELREVAREAAP